MASKPTEFRSYCTFSFNSFNQDCVKEFRKFIYTISYRRVYDFLSCSLRVKHFG